MSSTTEALWIKGNKIIKGRWRYVWNEQCFYITIDKKNKITGRNYETFSVYGDSPEWNNWKLMETI